MKDCEKIVEIFGIYSFPRLNLTFFLQSLMQLQLSHNIHICCKNHAWLSGGRLDPFFSKLSFYFILISEVISKLISNLLNCLSLDLWVDETWPKMVWYFDQLLDRAFIVKIAPPPPRGNVVTFEIFISRGLKLGFHLSIINWRGVIDDQSPLGLFFGAPP